MLCCPVASSPVLSTHQLASCTLHSTLRTSAFCILHPANNSTASCRPPRRAPASQSLVSVSATSSLVSCLSLPLPLRPSPPLAAGRPRLRPRHPSVQQTSSVVSVIPSIDFVPHRQTCHHHVSSVPTLFSAQTDPTLGLYRLGRMAPVRPQRKGVHIPHIPAVEPTTPLTR